MSLIRITALVATAACTLAGCGGAPAGTDAPAVTPSTSSSPSVEPFGGLRSAEIDDATAIAHLDSPRTGEVWHDPVPLGAAPAMLDGPADISYFDVGDHGDADIVVAVGERFEFSGYADIHGLFELGDADVRFIRCPTARTTAPCIPIPGNLNAGVSVDADTFYDSLTYPSSFEIMPGYALHTGVTLRVFETWESPLGDGNFILPAAGEDEFVYDPRASATATTLAAYGDVDVVQLEWPAWFGDGLTNIKYALRTPYGAIYFFNRDDIPASQYTAIAWDDGEFRTSYHDWDASDRVWGAGGGVCFPADWTIEATHLDEGWVEAGTARDGQRVWVPNGPNLTAISVRNAMDEGSFGWDSDTGDEVAYPYATIDEFLAAYALIAVQRPDGEWLVGLRPDAVNLAYECV